MAELKLVANAGHTIHDEQRPLSELISDLETLKAEHSAAQKTADDCKERKNAMEQLIIARLNEAKLSDASNGRYRASVTTEVVPSVTDWEQTYQYIADRGYFHLLYRQLNAGAFRELLDSGEKLPGCEPFEKEKLSFTKVAKKK